MKNKSHNFLIVLLLIVTAQLIGCDSSDSDNGNNGSDGSGAAQPRVEAVSPGENLQNQGLADGQSVPRIENLPTMIAQLNQERNIRSIIRQIQNICSLGADASIALPQIVSTATATTYEVREAAISCIVRMNAQREYFEFLKNMIVEYHISAMTAISALGADAVSVVPYILNDINTVLASNILGFGDRIPHLGIMIEALGRIGPAAKFAFPDVIRVIDNYDVVQFMVENRRSIIATQVIIALSRFGNEIIPDLVSELNSMRSGYRYRKLIIIVSVLKQYGRAASSALPALQDIRHSLSLSYEAQSLLDSAIQSIGPEPGRRRR